MDRPAESWKPREVARLLSLVEGERRYYQEILARLPVAVALVSRDLSLVGANRSFRRLFGLRVEQIAETNLTQVLPLEGLEAAAGEVLERGETRSLETVVPTATGRRKCRVTVQSIHGWDIEAEPELLLVVDEVEAEPAPGAAEDIADRQGLPFHEQAARIEALRRLAARVAHDCNNLLMIVGGYGEELMAGLPDGSAQQSSVVQILDACRRLASLSGELGAYSKVLSPRAETIEVNGMITTLVERLHGEWGPKIEIQTRLAGNLREVNGVAGYVTKALTMAASRARAAMPDGGRLTIETTPVVLDERSPETAGVLTPGAYVRLTLKDTGEPMDAETRQRLFEPFYARQRFGLDLDVVYREIRECGGDVWVSAAPGGGTSFAVWLPERRPTVLVVEDEAGIRSLLCKMLEREGYQVLEGSNGEEALRVCFARPEGVDLLLTDVVMPGMGGRELAEQIHGRHPDVKVLYISGYTDDVAVQAASFPRGSGYLQKPFTREALMSKVRQLLKASETSPDATD